MKANILFPITPFNIDSGSYPYGLALIGTMAKQAGYEVKTLISRRNETNLEPISASMEKASLLFLK